MIDIIGLSGDFGALFGLSADSFSAGCMFCKVAIFASYMGVHSFIAVS